MAHGREELLASEHADALSIADLYDEVQGALERAFPRRRAFWVRGEIQQVSAQQAARGHCYIDLVDPESSRDRQAPVLKVKCWQSTWGPMRATLARAGVELQPGMVVFLRGTIDFYRPKAEIGFILGEIDVTALLGRLAAKRAALLRALEAEGLLTRNRSCPVPDVPLRIGLVGSPGTEGYRDFLGQLAGSGFAFRVQVAPAAVQGATAPRAISAAVHRLSALGPGALDVIVVARGGGSKADLAAFDAEPVARAVATSSVPVWTGIGHTGDESVADVVANRACITPTECGRELVRLVEKWWEAAVESASLLRRSATAVLVSSQRQHDGARERLCAMARHLVDRQREHTLRRGGVIRRCAPQVLEDAWSSVLLRGARVAPLAQARLEHAEDRLASWRRLVAAYDVERQLERGYTLTLDEDGRIVRHAGEVGPGQRLVTRFTDGNVRSVAQAVDGRAARHDREQVHEPAEA
ncbi:MAG: exodeoxyribonuclease VII large subunit [Actinomycetota bacterium]|nr:exodeoxyribonuclease VII large subunit [Actinomycetota bacterium]